MAIAAAVAAKEQQDKAETQLQPLLAPSPAIGVITAVPVPRVRRRERGERIGQAPPQSVSPLVAVLPP